MISASQPALAIRELDSLRMAQALELAENAIGLSDPNPRVGCVIGDDGGHVVGIGWTQQVGGPHAEAVALADARAKGLDLRGATAWVTLEPCAHHGRTPPCCDALIGAGVSRVVVAIEDPFPQVAGAGIAKLRAAGVQVDMAPEAQAAAALELNIGFFSRVLRKRPWVRMKIAATLDGRTALPDGTSQWITSQEARRDGHSWRKRASVVMTGIGTVLADDPRLDVREVPTTVQPLRVVVDSGLRTPASARVLQPPGRAILFTAGGADAARHQLDGVEVIRVAANQDGVDLVAVLGELANRSVNEIHVEAGATLNGALLERDLVDELLVYLGPKVVGTGRGMADLSTRVNLNDALQFTFSQVELVGPDLRLLVRSAASAGWLARTSCRVT